MRADGMARTAKRLWGFDEEQGAVLKSATMGIPALREVIEGARPHGEIPGLQVLQATVAELDDVYTLVEGLTDATRSRKRRELLDDLRASLCSAMDGFLIRQTVTRSRTRPDRRRRARDATRACGPAGDHAASSGANRGR